MRNIILTIEYDGSRYQGWSRLGQEGSVNTISGKISDVIKKMTNESEIELHSGIRTEVGVHAYAQVANFLTETAMSDEDIKHYMNKYLPMDIAIIDVQDASERFHAKLNARSKTYVYRISTSDVPSVFDRKHTVQCFKTPDAALIRRGAMLMTGVHDFKNFSSGKSGKNTVREVYEIEVYNIEDELQILIHADDFLYNMARIMIGTLLDIGLGVRPADDIKAIFAGRKEASAPCDPKGLFLQEISYK